MAQGAAAQYVNAGAGYDDENSQAEGIDYLNCNNNVNAANGNGSNSNNNSNNVHYENLYEPLEPFADAANVVAPANNNNNNNLNNNNGNLNGSAALPRSAPVMYHPLAYRNEVYERNPAYDIPRGRRNLMERPRYINRQRRQRSFDDTESQQYVNYADYVKYENMYERVREEPEYQNTPGLYGRLDVIGHGIGRIERHLSSSCGNIDHYSLGGHYAVLGHSHLGTVGHIHLNQQQNSKDSTVKSFFSCLGGENSQSMTNIDRAGNNSTSEPPSSSSAMGSNRSNTGAVPKVNKIQQTTNNGANNGASNTSKQRPNAEHNLGTLNRISKSSLQWLLVNKWLPLWAGESPDYKVVDFNFMFSRNCDGCDPMAPVRFSDRPPIEGDYIPPPREYPSMNGSRCPSMIRGPQQLSRLNENHENEYQDDRLYDRPRGSHRIYNTNNYQDPFRNWAFNFDNNTFRPAGTRQHPLQHQPPQPQQQQPPQEIRRITEGTLQTVGRPMGQCSVLNQQPGPSSINVTSNQDAQINGGGISSTQSNNDQQPSQLSSAANISLDLDLIRNGRRSSSPKDDDLTPTNTDASNFSTGNNSVLLNDGKSGSFSDDTSQGDDNDE